MIYAELAGGLGNQMFIYAFARALGLRCGEPVTLLDRQDWRDGAPAHTVCALDALNISPDVKIIADAGFAKAHLPRRNAAKALMIKYEQRRGLMARDWHSFEAAAAPLLDAVDATKAGATLIAVGDYSSAMAARGHSVVQMAQVFQRVSEAPPGPPPTPPPPAATPAIPSRGGTSRVSATLRILPLL